jgi:hypothetical protein
MKRSSRAGWIFLASAIALFAAFQLVGVPRSTTLVFCGVDQLRHGDERELDGVRVRLPPDWCELERASTRGTVELRAVRIPRSRSSRDTLALVRHVNFELSREAIESAFSNLGFDTPQYGAWQSSALVDVDLGGRPGYEIRFERAVPAASGADEVAADFLLPELRVWVQCAPMSADDLAQCRAIAASAAATTATALQP